MHLVGFIISRFPLVRISDEQLSGHEGQLRENIFVCPIIRHAYILYLCEINVNRLLSFFPLLGQ